ncbi:hypothetical protein [Sulfurihydrogenibium sp.]|jgi:hypothetical protein|uniref:hypothetical protein n=1 Tax=Sulfurihydrogenibium sp. TaxID=2053621 RepID=UPI0026097CD3|nr:hypothetical protein [Sulfurihydrogenibium sp.]
MDAVIDRVKISINKDQITNNTIIEIKDSTTNETIATGKISNGKANPSHRYFAYIKDDYGSPEYGPIMVDVVEGDNGQISATMTAIEGDTGDLLLISGNGTKSGNSISFTASVIMCSDTNENGTGTAEFTGTIDANGNITGTFTNTLSAGDTCRENKSNIYKGTWRAEDVTNASPANVAGTYDVDSVATLQIAQNGISINVSITDINGTFTRSGQGIVYGNYVMFKVPIIMCHDTDPNAQAEYATFFGKFDSKTNTISGIYGDGIPPGDSCREGSAEGFWRATKR